MRQSRCHQYRLIHIHRYHPIHIHQYHQIQVQHHRIQYLLIHRIHVCLLFLCERQVGHHVRIDRCPRSDLVLGNLERNFRSLDRFNGNPSCLRRSRPASVCSAQTAMRRRARMSTLEAIWSCDLVKRSIEDEDLQVEHLRDEARVCGD